MFIDYYLNFSLADSDTDSLGKHTTWIAIGGVALLVVGLIVGGFLGLMIGRKNTRRVTQSRVIINDADTVC